jgi:hypothetical protein
MARTRDLRGPIPLLMFPLAAGKQFRQRVEERMFPVGALREHRTESIASSIHAVSARWIAASGGCSG